MGDPERPVQPRISWSARRTASQTKSGWVWRPLLRGVAISFPNTRHDAHWLVRNDDSCINAAKFDASRLRLFWFRRVFVLTGAEDNFQETRWGRQSEAKCPEVFQRGRSQSRWTVWKSVNPSVSPDYQSGAGISKTHQPAQLTSLGISKLISQPSWPAWASVNPSDNPAKHSRYR